VTFKRLQLLLAMLLCIAGIGLASSAAYFAYLTNELKTGDFVYWPYAADGQRFARHLGQDATSNEWAPLQSIPEPCQHIFVAAEDLAFYDHDGVVWENIWIALQINFRQGRIVFGASTITQQLAKNLFLWRDKTIVRKTLEIIAALVLDASFSKKEILELYLNAVEFGPNIYGIEAASNRYFNKEVSKLNIFECGILAGTLPFPKRHAVLLLKGEFDETIAGQVAPMLRHYAHEYPKRGQLLLELLEKALSTKMSRN
jgi:membrane peptidoglycan carboxypeptidase